LLPLLMTGFFLFFGFLGMVTFLTFRLTNAPFYFTSADIGWISLAGLTAVIGSPLSGILAKKTGVFKIMIISLSLCLISVQLMGWIPLTLPVCTGLLLLFLGVYFPVWKLFGWQGVTLICSGSLVIAMALCMKGKKQLWKTL